jgi:hypothetical protein
VRFVFAEIAALKTSRSGLRLRGGSRFIAKSHRDLLAFRHSIRLTVQSLGGDAPQAFDGLSFWPGM